MAYNMVYYKYQIKRTDNIILYWEEWDMCIFGYARVSTMKQRIERQIDNIKREYPEAVIITEEYTGTTTDRPKWNKLIEQIKRECTKKKDVTLVFDEVSRMSRNAVEGINLYEELFDMGVNLIFLKEPHINSSVYRDKLNRQIEKLAGTGSKATDKLLDTMLSALHEYTIDIAKEQIEIAFNTAQAEVEYLHQRTSEGVRKAQAAGKQIGRQAGAKQGKDFKENKKSVETKKIILKHNKDFGKGDLNDIETMKLCGISRNTYYKYKSQLKGSRA